LYQVLEVTAACIMLHRHAQFIFSFNLVNLWVLTLVTMRIVVFCVVIVCSLVDVMNIWRSLLPPSSG